METPLQQKNIRTFNEREKVTILILVETPLQQKKSKLKNFNKMSHNPYFSGNSFATLEVNFNKGVEIRSQSLF